MCKELTPEELKTANGCGSSHPMLWVFRLPKWVSAGLTRCCNRHDIRYQNQEDKDRADDEMYDCQMYNAFHSPRWQRPFKIMVAEIMYKAITSKFSNMAYQNQSK